MSPSTTSTTSVIPTTTTTNVTSIQNSNVTSTTSAIPGTSPSHTTFRETGFYTYGSHSINVRVSKVNYRNVLLLIFKFIVTQMAETIAGTSSQQSGASTSQSFGNIGGASMNYDIAAFFNSQQFSGSGGHTAITGTSTATRTSSVPSASQAVRI